MDRVMNRILYEDPFLAEKHRAHKPLYAALVPDEVFKGAHFERRFVTPFGHAWEQVALVVARARGATAAMGHAIHGTIPEERLRRIQEVLNRLEFRGASGPRVPPNWREELNYILQGGGASIPTTVVCDLHVQEAASGLTYAFEIKAPLPNSDQTKVSKEKLLKLHSMVPQPVAQAFFALPYNPFGRRQDYEWSFPARWFNMREDPVVLIGEEFWHRLGGPGTYEAFISAVNEIGPEYKLRIYREFLGIEPPEEATKVVL
jgi:hypothetical protein